MNDITTTRMLLTTAALAAVAALFAGGANAKLMDVDGGTATGAAAVPTGPGTIPYLSHGIGVDESLFAGEQPSIGLTGDSALSRVSAPEPKGLTGDSPLGRAGITSVVGDTTAGASNDDDWTWVGLGSGLAALFAVAFGAMFLSARHRGRVALP